MINHKAIRVIEKRIEELNKEIKLSKKILDEPELNSDIYFAESDIKNFNQEISQLKHSITILIKSNENTI